MSDTHKVHLHFEEEKNMYVYFQTKNKRFHKSKIIGMYRHLIHIEPTIVFAFGQYVLLIIPKV